MGMGRVGCVNWGGGGGGCVQIQWYTTSEKSGTSGRRDLRRMRRVCTGTVVHCQRRVRGEEECSALRVGSSPSGGERIHASRRGSAKASPAAPAPSPSPSISTPRPVPMVPPPPPPPLAPAG
jgi:hypothetical protein